jgi:hypothetical protein
MTLIQSATLLETVRGNSEESFMDLKFPTETLLIKISIMYKQPQC